jgi:rhodanese-related sulfurtransferase
MVLTGDSLLVGDVGRPDFGGGDAAAQQQSIARLLELPDWVAVFPGHFEGPCGRGMCGRPSTTIGFERRFNPLARLDPEAFVATLQSGVPPRPLNMTAIEATNRGLLDMPSAVLRGWPTVEEVGPEAVEQRGPDALLLDVREPGEYAAGHIPGAVNLPQADLATRLSDLPDDGLVIVVCQTAQRSLRAAQFLKQAGFDRIVHLRGGTSEWRRSGRPLEQDGGPAVVTIVESAWAHAGMQAAH